MNAIFNRTSVRKYQDKAVEDEKIDLLLRAAMAAPSAGNQQPWEFYVTKNKDILEQLAHCSPYAECLKGASVAIIPCYNKDALRMPEYADIDMSIACENILLEAVELGLGAVLLGIAPLGERMVAVKKVLHAGNHLEPFAIISCGYPQEESEQQDRFDGKRVHWIDGKMA